MPQIRTLNTNILRKLEGIINDNYLLIAYQTLTQPHIDYCPSRMVTELKNA